MKFLFCVPRYHTNLHYQVKALQNHGHEVFMCALYKGGSEDHSAIKPSILGYSRLFLLINRFFNPAGGSLIKNSFELKYGFPPISSLWKEISRSHADVVVIKNIHSIFSLMAFIFAFICGSRAVFLLQIPKRRRIRSLSIAILDIFNIPVVTPILGELKLPEMHGNLFYIPFPIEAKDYGKEYVSDGKIRILCVGKFQERKDQLILARALQELRYDYDFHLTLIGQDDEIMYKEILVSYIDMNHLKNHVSILPHRSWKDALDAYRNFDLFVLPSYLEAASYSILEAMAAKLCVICSDDNGTACYIEDGRNGFIFKHKDIESLKEVLKKAMINPKFLKSMGEASFEIAQHKHSLDLYYKQFMDVVSYKK